MAAAEQRHETVNVASVHGTHPEVQCHTSTTTPAEILQRRKPVGVFLHPAGTLLAKQNNAIGISNHGRPVTPGTFRIRDDDLQAIDVRETFRDDTHT